jgi:hemerythrin-like domain-containing protein
MEFSDELMKEHEPIRRALSLLRSVREQIQAGDSVDVHDVNAILLFLHSFADCCHQEKEESLLFPALKWALHDQQEPALDIESLIAAHREECDLIGKTQTALFTGARSLFAEYARQLIELFTEHLAREEQVLFPLSEKILTEQQLMALAVGIRQANAMFGERHLAILMDMLKQLEQKFGLEAA